MLFICCMFRFGVLTATRPATSVGVPRFGLAMGRGHGLAMQTAEWEEFFKGHPKAKTLKTSPLAFPELCIALFEGTSATGSRVYAPSSTRERTVSSSFTSHIHTTQNEEEDEEDEEGQNGTIEDYDVYLREQLAPLMEL
ncbi:hypothetical protein L6452_03425 [Arctium lappa]|uniref:Uncharacterized protein n=1 Tax=Arctium lappa TaxID=4217 RepID=A0ACB9FMR7_ARCLA|nr:hypothetical protein L6452_03425 [Arctium lappa]